MLIGHVAEAGLSAPVVMTLIFAMYLVLGCFFGPIEMLLITLPFVFPVVTGLGFDPVWFGIALVIVIEIGLLTPPLGINLFVVMAVCARVLATMVRRRCVCPKRRSINRLQRMFTPVLRLAKGEQPQSMNLLGRWWMRCWATRHQALFVVEKTVLVCH